MAQLNPGGLSIPTSVPPMLPPVPAGHMPVSPRAGDPHRTHAQDLLAVGVLRQHRGQVTRGVLQRGDSQPSIQTTAACALGRGAPRFVVQPGCGGALGSWRMGPAPAGAVVGTGVCDPGLSVCGRDRDRVPRLAGEEQAGRQCCGAEGGHEHPGDPVRGQLAGQRPVDSEPRQAS